MFETADAAISTNLRWEGRSKSRKIISVSFGLLRGEERGLLGAR
jgi:hypothetical protein